MKIHKRKIEAPRRADIWDAVSTAQANLAASADTSDLGFAIAMSWRGTWRGWLFETGLFAFILAIYIPALAIPSPTRVRPLCKQCGGPIAAPLLVVHWLLWTFAQEPEMRVREHLECAQDRAEK